MFHSSPLLSSPTTCVDARCVMSTTIIELWLDRPTNTPQARHFSFGPIHLSLPIRTILFRSFARSVGRSVARSASVSLSLFTERGSRSKNTSDGGPMTGARSPSPLEHRHGEEENALRTTSQRRHDGTRPTNVNRFSTIRASRELSKNFWIRPAPWLIRSSSSSTCRKEVIDALRRRVLFY
jgi:hypothetical protein